MQGLLLSPVGTAEAPSFSMGETRASDLPWLYENTEEGWATARFSIRSDNKITDYLNHNSDEYFGRSAGKPGNNRGKVSTLYPYGHYNDRDLDYTQKDKKTGENIGLFRYVYDPEGKKTQMAILEAPTVEEILGDEVEDLTAAIANGQKVEANTAKLKRVNDMLAKGPEYLNSHVIWYVVKEVGTRYGWHVNGVIADDPAPVPPFIDVVTDDVVVDIHQQEHTDWNAIKTSIHVRADIENIKINIPLKEQDIIEQDDFDIRIYQNWYLEYEPIEVQVTHDENGITIEVTNIPADLIKKMKEDFGDGLTIEVYSYTIKGDIWDDLKKSRIVSLGKACTVDGQVTSALVPGERVQLYSPYQK
ncbi:MAG: hypothetical protein IKQ51_08680 [Bacteroidaceae bacterium]|nr:hypothetical protein [Bacteroidaceae bacterium]